MSPSLAEQTQLDDLETIVGPLIRVGTHLKPGTLQHADELTNSRRDNGDLRRQTFYTADFAMYTATGGEEFFHLARGKNNLIFKNLFDATYHLEQHGEYVIRSREDIGRVVNAEDTLTVKLSDLDLKTGCDKFDNWAYFEIDTAEYEKLNKSQLLVAERVYGHGDDFARNMQMLREAGITITRINVLDSKYVIEHVKEGSAIARATRLYEFKHHSDFFADVINVDGQDRMRGVKK